MPYFLGILVVATIGINTVILLCRSLRSTSQLGNRPTRQSNTALTDMVVFLCGRFSCYVLSPPSQAEKTNFSSSQPNKIKSTGLGCLQSPRWMRLVVSYFLDFLCRSLVDVKMAGRIRRWQNIQLKLRKQVALCLYFVVFNPIFNIFGIL